MLFLPQEKQSQLPASLVALGLAETFLLACNISSKDIDRHCWGLAGGLVGAGIWTLAWLNVLKETNQIPSMKKTGRKIILGIKAITVLAIAGVPTVAGLFVPELGYGCAGSALFCLTVAGLNRLRQRKT